MYVGMYARIFSCVQLSSQLQCSVHQLVRVNTSAVTQRHVNRSQVDSLYSLVERLVMSDYLAQAQSSQVDKICMVPKRDLAPAAYRPFAFSLPLPNHVVWRVYACLRAEHPAAAGK